AEIFIRYSYYIEGNINSKYADVSADNWTIGLFNQVDKGTKVDYHNATEEELHAFVPMEFAAVTTHSAEDAYERVLKYAGASLSRDEYDEMMVADTRDGAASCIVNGIGKGLINSQDDITYADGSTGFPKLTSLEAKADSDGDGMPDEWETVQGLNPNDPEDGPATAENGYTNLENYLNGLVAHIVEGGNEGGVLLDGQKEFGTGVDQILNNVTSDSRTFNLQGVEVNEDAKGILIRNGRKVMVND
ncbi:MAG: thrombospondin type 3 repeat-containing protein, partial [Muribaculaceae bacterium]|nr:thrombospondin type 3 repeat-containing protein [Muribaculaceae bacterium]